MKSSIVFSTVLLGALFGAAACSSDAGKAESSSDTQAEEKAESTSSSRACALLSDQQADELTGSGPFHGLSTDAQTDTMSQCMWYNTQTQQTLRVVLHDGVPIYYGCQYDTATPITGLGGDACAYNGSVWFTKGSHSVEVFHGAPKVPEDLIATATQVGQVIAAKL